MYCDKTKIIDDFNKILIEKNDSLISNIIEGDKNYSIVEKLVLVDIYVSYKLFQVNGFKFNTEECIQEILNLNKIYLDIAHLNNVFVKNMLEDIKCLLDDKSLKTNFDLNMHNIDAYIYLNIILKSLQCVDYNNLRDIDAIVDNMLHRNIVINNINQNTMVYKILNVNKNIKKNTIKIIMCLGTLISQKKIIIREKKKIKSNFYLKLNLILKFNYKDYLYINYSNVEYKHTSTYLIGASHLTISKFMKKSNWQISENFINLEPLIKLSNQPIFIEFNDWDFIKTNIYKLLLKKFNINIGVTADINDVINELISQKINQNFLFKKLKKISLKKNNINIDNYIEDSIIEDTKSFISFNKLELTADVDKNFFLSEIFDNEVWSRLEVETDNLSIIIQKLYYISIAEKAKDLKYPIYIPYYYDFRGRIYPRSSIGFTYMKLLRPNYKLNDGFDKTDLIKSVYYNQIIKNIEPNIFDIINKNISEENKYFLTLHFLELGKFFKKKKINPEGLDLSSFTKLGMELFYNFKEDDFELEDLIYIKSIYKNIKLFLEKNYFNNILIIRDSTASFLQHWGTNLGIKNEYLKKLNLDGSRWFDAYSLIIELFLLKNNKYSLDKFSKILNRKILKNFIMIVNYNAGRHKCYKNLKLILNEEGIVVDDNDLKLFCEEFHEFLKSSLFEVLFIKPKDEFLLSIGNIYQCSDNTSINLAYLSSKQIKEDIKIKDYRWVFVKNELLNFCCEWKTNIAINANIIQACDAELARYIVNNLENLPVHDSFGVSLFKVHKLMDITNKYFNIKLNNNTYCLFILI